MSAEVKWAIPKKGTLVRYPGSKTILPETGGQVPWIGPDGRYWRRRLREESITILESNPAVSVYKEKKNDGGYNK
jgi:hypothetical protein